MAEAFKKLMAEKLQKTPPDPVDRGTVLPFTRNMLTGERSLAWPQFALEAWDAFTLPGDVYAGKIDPTSEEGIRRALGLAGIVTGGGTFVPKPSGAITMGPRRIPPYKRMPSTQEDFAREIGGVLDTGQSSRGTLFREDLGDITIDLGIPGNPSQSFKGGWGLDHIASKRTDVDGIDGEDFVRSILPNLLANGKLNRLFGKNKDRRAVIETDDEEAILRRYRYGKDPIVEDWLLSAYPKHKGKK